MKKPKDVECRNCRRWYWYGNSCSAYSYDEDLGIDPMSPNSIEDCDYFEIKIESELNAETYDSLPNIETIRLVRKIRLAEYEKLTDKVLTLMGVIFPK